MQAIVVDNPIFARWVYNLLKKMVEIEKGYPSFWPHETTADSFVVQAQKLVDQSKTTSTAAAIALIESAMPHLARLQAGSQATTPDFIDLQRSRALFTYVETLKAFKEMSPVSPLDSHQARQLTDKIATERIHQLAVLLEEKHPMISQDMRQITSVSDFTSYNFSHWERENLLAPFISIVRAREHFNQLLLELNLEEENHRTV